jgi:two-component system, NarL family, nitrate/nitrite response regulator NarL
MPVKVCIYEDNDVMREGLSQILSYSGNYIVVGSFVNCDDVEYQTQSLLADVILMDIEMAGTNGIQGIQRIRAINESVKIIVLSVFEDNKNVFDAICSGANGYLLKKSVPEKIFDAIDDVLNGGSPMSAAIASKVLRLLADSKPKPGKDDYSLTPREKEILQSLVKGNSYKMIAVEMLISQDTVKTHLKRIYEKLQVHSQTEAVVKAINERIV